MYVILFYSINRRLDMNIIRFYAENNHSKFHSNVIRVTLSCRTKDYGKNVNIPRSDFNNSPENLFPPSIQTTFCTRTKKKKKHIFRVKAARFFLNLRDTK